MGSISTDTCKALCERLARSAESELLKFVQESLGEEDQQRLDEISPCVRQVCEGYEKFIFQSIARSLWPKLSRTGGKNDIILELPNSPPMTSPSGSGSVSRNTSTSRLKTSSTANTVPGAAPGDVNINSMISPGDVHPRWNPNNLALNMDSFTSDHLNGNGTGGGNVGALAVGMGSSNLTANLDPALSNDHSLRQALLGLQGMDGQKVTQQARLPVGSPVCPGLSHNPAMGVFGRQDSPNDGLPPSENNSFGAGVNSNFPGSNMLDDSWGNMGDETIRALTESIMGVSVGDGSSGGSNLYSGVLGGGVSGMQGSEPQFWARGLDPNSLNSTQPMALFQHLQAWQTFQQQQQQVNQQQQQQHQHQLQRQLLLVQAQQQQQQQQQQQAVHRRPGRAATLPPRLMQQIAAGGVSPMQDISAALEAMRGGPNRQQASLGSESSFGSNNPSCMLLDGMPTRFRVLPIGLQEAVRQLTLTSNALSLKDFDDKVVNKMALMVGGFGQDECMTMMANLMDRIKMKQGSVKNGPGYLDVAVSSHLDMLKSRDLFPASCNVVEYARHALTDNVYQALVHAIESNQWLLWEHLDQGIIQLLRKLPVESATAKLREISVHSFKNVASVRGCLMSILSSRLREDRRIASARSASSVV